ncbi:MAG: mechanosensitive ion channel [Lewinella sp.]|nr:mechanosensitive ion channel [Lewinella sp.]
MQSWFDPERLTELITAYAPKVGGALLTLIIGLWIIGWLTRILRRRLQASTLSNDLIPFLSSMFNITLKVLLLLSVAGMFGVETTSFVAILGAAAFAIGLALQGTLGHFASGVLILTFRPYSVGDFVVTQGYAGTVAEIQIFNTILTTLDNREVIVPNGAVTSGPIENLTRRGERRLDLTFGIGYGDDIDQARAVLDEVINRCPGVMMDKGYDILVKELADSSVNFAVRFWTKVEDFWPAHFFMQEEVKKAFDKAGVNIPFPQMDVHVQQA